MAATQRIAAGAVVAAAAAACAASLAGCATGVNGSKQAAPGPPKPWKITSFRVIVPAWSG